MSLPYGRSMKFRLLTGASFISVILLSFFSPSASAAGGFNEYGYNYKARIFSGPADGVDKKLDGKIWGRWEAYAKDHLVMKWNAAWDACNTNGNNNPKYCAGAWNTNEWNGNVPGGSGETEHFKSIWVGSLGINSPYWIPGGKLIWDNYEAIFDRGMDADHSKWVYAFASPSGLGFSK